MSKAIIAIIIIACTVFLYTKETFSLAVTSMLSVTAMMTTGVLTASDAFSCFSNDVVMLIAGMMFIVEAFTQTGLIGQFGALLGKYVNKGEKNFVILLTIVLAFGSLFINNSPLMTAFLPLVTAIIGVSGGAITKKNTFMPMAFACLIGGCGSLAGTTLPGVVSNVLVEYGQKEFRFFETLPVTLIILFVVVICYKLFLFDLMKRIFDFEEAPDMATSDAEETVVFHKRNATVTLIVFALCVIGFVTTPFGWTVGQISIVSAVILIVTKCIDGRESLKRVNWSILIVIASTLGIAKGFVVSGAGQIVINWMMNTFGHAMNQPVVLFLVFMITGYLLSMFMSNGSLCAMLTAVAVPLAMDLGQDPLPVALGLSFACQQAMATPAASVTIALSQGANYRFKDYLRFGGLMGTICFVTGCLAIILIYGLI